MATINVKEESSTPDSLSDYETKTHDKRLSLAEELDATQNELKEAEDKLTAAIQQVRILLVALKRAVQCVFLFTACSFYESIHRGFFCQFVNSHATRHLHACL